MLCSVQLEFVVEPVSPVGSEQERIHWRYLRKEDDAQQELRGLSSSATTPAPVVAAGSSSNARASAGAAAAAAAAAVTKAPTLAHINTTRALSCALPCTTSCLGNKRPDLSASAHTIAAVASKGKSFPAQHKGIAQKARRLEMDRLQRRATVLPDKRCAPVGKCCPGQCLRSDKKTCVPAGT
jgi:hypothetical protein